MTATNSVLPKNKVVFEASKIYKHYGSTKALNDVSLSVREGEFVALLGPNGSGKSTLVKILGGVVPLDSGMIKTMPEFGGIGIIHQDLGLIESMSIAENFYIGPGMKWLNLKEENQFASDALSRVGITQLNPQILIGELSLGQRTMVAVAKLLSHGNRVVVVDEVTAGLPPTEATWLVEHLRNAADLGTTVLMVTHRVREILGFADRYVVLIDGRIESDIPSELATYDKLINLLSAKKNWTSKPISESPEILLAGAGTQIVCQLVKAKYKNTGPIDLNLKCGQIVGITGLVGSGLHEIAYMVAGLVKPSSGSVVIEDHVVSKCIPAHRETEGVFPDETEEFNLAVGNWRRWRRRNGILDIRKMRRESISVSMSLNLVPLNPEMQVSRLSGGNQQKTLLGRSLINDPDLLVLCEPTRGVDVATRQEIYSQIIAAARRGTAVFIASSDVEDLRSIAQVVGIVDIEGVISQWIDNLGADSLDILESAIH